MNLKFYFLIIFFLINNFSFDKKKFLDGLKVSIFLQSFYFLNDMIFNRKKTFKETFKYNLKINCVNIITGEIVSSVITEITNKIFNKNITIEKSIIPLNIKSFGEKINKLKELLLKEKPVILHGPPGTGKTFIIENVCKKEELELIKISPKDFTYNIYDINQYEKIFNEYEKVLKDKKYKGVYIFFDEFNALFKEINENQGMYGNENKQTNNFHELNVFNINAVKDDTVYEKNFENIYFENINKNNKKLEEKRKEIIKYIIDSINKIKKIYKDKIVYLSFATNNIEIVEKNEQEEFNFLEFQKLKTENEFKYFLKSINEKILDNMSDKEKKFSINETEIDILLKIILEKKYSLSIIELEGILNKLILEKMFFKDTDSKRIEIHINNNIETWVKR